MSYDPHQPPIPVTPLVGPARTRNPLWIILGAAVVLVVAIAGAVAITLSVVGQDDGIAIDRPGAAVAEPQLGDDPALDEGEILPDPAPTTPVPVVTPAVSDFILKPKITDRECFGSAGCNVVFKVDLTYGGSSPLDESTTWLITYEVTGIEDGPMIGSLEITGDTFTGEGEIVQTKSSKSKLVLKVTDVSKVGI